MPRLPIESASATRVTINGQNLLAFGGCNYLGLGQDAAVHAALIAAMPDFGISTTASRETTGNTLAHEELETTLSRFLEQEHAILSAEGYTANFIALQTIAQTCRIAIIDSQAHRSIRHAAIAAGMQVFDYEHLSPASAQWLVGQYADQGIAIITDSVFAADGAIAPLPALLGVLPAKRSFLLVDDCHGFCVLGRGGRGAVNHFGLNDPRIVITTTLAKGLGCYGGVVAGRRSFIDQAQQTAWVYRGSTPVPPAIARACTSAVSLLEADSPATGRNATLRKNIQSMRTGFVSLGLPLPPEGVPIFTFTLATEPMMQRVYSRLLSRGILAPLIEYPGGPAPLYFRVVVNAMHTTAEIEKLISFLAEEIANDRANAQPARAERTSLEVAGLR